MNFGSFPQAPASGRCGMLREVGSNSQAIAEETNLTILGQTISTPAIFDTMYKVQFDGKSFELKDDADGLTVNGQRLEWDLVDLGGGQFHIRYKNQSYPAEVIEVDHETKMVELSVRGQRYSVKLREDVDVLMEKMGMNTGGSGKVNSIKAPMPGLIIDLRVSDGQDVNAGDSLLILEAMKMENIIKSPGAGKVKKVKIKKGDSVEKGQVLIEF